MKGFDLIVVGLGPAGAYLAHRAQARGIRVLGIDRTLEWQATYGGWADELTGVPVHYSGKPSVRFGAGTLATVLERDYAIIDNVAWRAQIMDFPAIIGEAEIHSSNSVQVGEENYLAQVVVDARGNKLTAGQPVQQALGLLVDDGPTTWMDFDSDTFLYSFPTPNGHLIEETFLVTEEVQDWALLEEKLRRRFPTAHPHAVEKVLIPLGKQFHNGPALNYGARAGFVNPISGFSVGTSIAMAEPTLDALWGTGNLPWRNWQFRTDRNLALWLQVALVRLPPPQLHDLLRTLLRLPTPIHRDFLRLGNLRGTVIGMALVFAGVRWSTKLKILQALTYPNR